MWQIFDLPKYWHVRIWPNITLEFKIQICLSHNPMFFLFLQEWGFCWYSFLKVWVHSTLTPRDFIPWTILALVIKLIPQKGTGQKAQINHNDIVLNLMLCFRLFNCYENTFWIFLSSLLFFTFFSPILIDFISRLGGSLNNRQHPGHT